MSINKEKEEMLNLNYLNEKQINKYIDFGLSKPVGISNLDVSASFIYCREYGGIYVPGGYHQQAAALLLAFNLGFNNGIEAGEFLKIKSTSRLAEYWMENTEGAAIKSSVGKKIQIYSEEKLNEEEKQYFIERICIQT